MTADITDCLTLLQSSMGAALVPTYCNAVFKGRRALDKLAVSMSISYAGGAPAGSTTGGRTTQFYDMVASIAATTDGSDDELEAAEQALNDLENQIYLQLTGALRLSIYWDKVTFPTASVRPPNFSFSPTTRYGEVPFRLHLT